MLSSSSKLTSQLRRAISIQDAMTEPEVRNVRWVLVAVVLTLVVMAVADIVYTQSMMGSLSDATEALWRDGDRSLAFKSAMMLVHALIALNQNVTFQWSANETVTALTGEIERFRAAHEFLYLAGEDAGAAAHAFEMKQTHEIVEVSSSGAINGRFQMPLTELGEYMASKLDRLVRIPVEEVVPATSEVRNLLANADAMEAALDRSNFLREQEYVEMRPDFQLQLIISGTVVFFITVVASTLFFVIAVRSLGLRTEAVLRTFLHVPGRVAKAMQKRAMALLNRAIATENENEDEDENEAEEMERFIQEDDTNAALSSMMNVMRRAGSRLSTLTRPYTNSSRYVLTNMLKLLSPVVFIFGWLLFLVVFQITVNMRAEAATQRMVRVQHISGLLLHYTDALSEVAVPGLLSAAAMNETIAHANELDLELLATAKTIMFGGSLSTTEGLAVELPELTRDTKIYTVFVRNACVASDIPDVCRAVSDGILSKGVYSGILALVNLGHKIISDTLESDASDVILSNYRELVGLESPHLRTALFYASETLNTEAQLETTTGLDTVTVVSSVFVAVFAIFSLFFYIPVINVLALPLRSSRSLLTVIPDEIIFNIPDLRNAIQDVATEAQLGRRNARGHANVPIARANNASGASTAADSAKEEEVDTGGMGFDDLDSPGAMRAYVSQSPAGVNRALPALLASPEAGSGSGSGGGGGAQSRYRALSRKP